MIDLWVDGEPGSIAGAARCRQSRTAPTVNPRFLLVVGRRCFPGGMPVIVIGADTRIGRAIVERLLEPDREIRVFVSDPENAEQLREMGVKTAFGDVTDFSHVSAACTGVFTAVLVGEAARDGRERSFAEDERTTFEGWAGAAEEAAASRIIWVGVADPPPTPKTEAAVVGDDLELGEVAQRVALLDEVDQLR